MRQMHLSPSKDQNIFNLAEETDASFTFKGSK